MASHISHNATLWLDSQCGTHTRRTPKNTRCCQKILTIDYYLFYSRIQQSTEKLFQYLHCFGNEKLGIWLHAFVQPAQIYCFHVFAFAACIQMLSYARIAHIAVCDANLLIRLKFSERQNDSLWYPYKNNTFACRYLSVWILAQKFSLFLSSYNYWTGMNAK